MTQFEKTIDRLIAETKAEAKVVEGSHPYGTTSRCEATWVEGKAICTKKHRALTR